MSRKSKAKPKFECPICKNGYTDEQIDGHIKQCKKRLTKQKQNRYLQFVQYFLGNEEGLKFYTNRSNKARTDLKYLTFLYGKEEAQYRYDRYANHKKIQGKIEYYIQKFGPIEGPIKYKQKNSKLSVGIDVLRKAGKTEEEIAEIKKTHGKKSGITYENMLRVHQDPQVALDKLMKFREGIKGRAFTIEWWMKEKGMSYEDARAKMLSIQRKDLDYYVNRLGEKLGKERYAEVYKKRVEALNPKNIIANHGLDHYNEIAKNQKSNSKAQIELAKYLYDKLEDKYKINFSAYPVSKSKSITLTESEMVGHSIRYIVPDIVIGNIVIEYDGDYWHNRPGVPEKDIIKTQILEKRGYKVLRILENQYKKNKQHRLEKTIKFILENYEDKID